jgi:sugar/nucleoside kinase (ribokinase family)
MVVIHSQLRAAAVWRDAAWGAGGVCVEGMYNANPVRTTGVGDRFNAGLTTALAAGASPPSAVAMGCAAGAWFVTKGRVLTSADLPTLAAWIDHASL